MKSKKFLLQLLIIALVSFGLTFGAIYFYAKTQSRITTQSVSVKVVGNDIAASGEIHSQNEATLHFQTGGKLAYLPVKEGDTIVEGQTIAQLDTTPLQQELSLALNNYVSTRDTFDQTNSNAGTGVLQQSQKNALNLYSQTAVGGGDAEQNAINDAVNRIIQQNQATLNNSVIAVQSANYALQLATLSSPFNGVVISEDVTSAGVNVTTATSFLIEDPNLPVFRANISAQDIDFVSVGATAKIQFAGDTKIYNGTVTKIYPKKLSINLASAINSGPEVYQVDVSADGLKGIAKLGENGTVVISSSLKQKALLVPTWTIVGHNFVWVLENNKPILKQVQTGNTHGDFTEVLSGLNEKDKVIINPASVARKNYQIVL